MSDKSFDGASLIYPPRPPEVTTYVMWATPISGKGPLRLGDLGKGEARFQVKQTFSSLFVTIEANANVKAPSSSIIMTGGVEPISFLQRPTTPTPTPEPEVTITEEESSSTSSLSTREKLLVALRRAGIAAVIALVAIVGLIFVVTRSRG